MKGLLAALCLAVLLAGCADARSKAAQTIDRVGVATLRRDAAVLYKDLFATRGLDLTVLKPNRWPPSFAAFKPLYVGAYQDGFVIALRKEPRGEAGIYVTPLGMEHAPISGERATYEPMADGLYWYSFRE